MVAALDLRHLAEDNLDIVEAVLVELAPRNRGRGSALAWLGIGKVDEAVR